MWGSAKHSNHWTTTDPSEPIPERYVPLLNGPGFEPISWADLRPCGRIRRSGSGVSRGGLPGSRFTIRVVENDPQDRRTLYVQETARA